MFILKFLLERLECAYTFRLLWRTGIKITLAKLSKINVLMRDNDNDNEKANDNRTSPTSPTSSRASSLKIKFYELAQSTKSSLNSKVYAATGIKLDQKKLIISFVCTLIKDFALAYSVRGSLKLIPKLLKMIQSLR